MTPSNTTRERGGHSATRRILPIVLCTAALLLGLSSAALAVVLRSGSAPSGSGPAAHLVSDLAPDGYWLVGSDGGIFAYGGAQFYGSTGAIVLNQPIVGMSATPDSKGYWMVASDGGIFAFGDAAFFGSTGGQHLNQPIVGMASTPDGKGYWLVASDGGIFAFGDAAFFGSTGGQHLNQPIVDMAAAPDGKGYWLAASDGGVFTFGSVTFHGSAGALPLASPIQSISASPDGGGYWMAASDGGVFNYGSAPFYGSGVGLTGSGSMVDLAPDPQASGYWMADSNGGVFALGDTAFFGSAFGADLKGGIVGMAPSLVPAVNPSVYTIAGDAPAHLMPGSSGAIDLQITNPNSAPITIVSNSITVTTSVGGCGPANFSEVRSLARPVTVAAGSTMTLSELGLARQYWPAISMLETATNQDACKQATLTLHYRGEAVG